MRVVRTYVVTSQGSAYARFQRALATGNLLLIRATAAELPRVDLGDALSICVAIRHAEPERFERAAPRWLARFCVERPGATLDDVRAAAWAFERMGSDPNGALETLRSICGLSRGARRQLGGRRSIADTGSVHSDRKVLRC